MERIVHGSILFITYLCDSLLGNRIPTAYLSLFITISVIRSRYLCCKGATGYLYSSITNSPHNIKIAAHY